MNFLVGADSIRYLEAYHYHHCFNIFQETMECSELAPKSFDMKLTALLMPTPLSHS